MKSADLYKLFFEEASDALAAITLKDSKVFCVNPAFCSLSGFTREEVEGEAVALLSGAHQEDVRDRRLNLEIVSTPGFYNDVAVNTRDGQLRYVSVRVRHVTVEGESLALVVLQDETERQLLMRDLFTKHQSLEMAFIDLERVHSELKSTQERMFQASKLVAVGELAAGMSHELNQPLTGIRGFAQEIQDRLKHEAKPSKKEIGILLQDIVANADKMASLLSLLRDFARKEKTNGKELAASPEPVSLQKSFSNASRLFQRQLANSNIVLEERGLAADLEVMARPHPLEQVLINLIANSRDAIQEKRLVQKQLQGHILVSAERQGEWIRVRVNDNGCGVPEKIRDKIFDPFFSTKEHSKGMGLGLSISFGIVHQLGGELSLESSSASGTTFVIKLKAAALNLKARAA